MRKKAAVPAQQRATRATNAALIDLYWLIGQYLHRRIEADGGAKDTVIHLAATIAQREPGRQGFSAQNLWRMRQFFQAYQTELAVASALSTVLGEEPWSAHLHILSRTKHVKGRKFYLLPDKRTLAAKLHDFDALNAPEPAGFVSHRTSAPQGKRPPKRGCTRCRPPKLNS